MIHSYLLSFLLIFHHLLLVNAWDTKELEMFDLVEELDRTFYEFMSIERTASLSDIKRAYRKLSLELHPDKNPDDPDASRKFRQLTTVYHTLKDKELRKSYDSVLDNGLPDWRTPVFYYRTLRKMSNTELAVLATTFSIVIHFAAVWGHTFEKRWTLRERLETHYKRHKASDKRKIAIDVEIAEQLKAIASPTLWDILPIYLVRVVFNFIVSIPSCVSSMIKLIRDIAEEKRKTKEEIKELERLEEERKLRKTQKKKQQPEKLQKDPLDVDVSLLTTFSPDNLRVSTDELCEADDRPITTKEWTADEEAIFIRLTNKYPGGFPNRWRKIAEVLGRSVADVTARASAISARMSERMQLNPDFEPDEANASGAEEEDSDDYYLSRRKAKRLGKAPKISAPKDEASDEDEGPVPVDGGDDAVDSDDQVGYTSRNKQKKQGANKSGPQRKLEENSAASGGWSQKEQIQLETAIKSIPKGVPERWQRIAECVPTKSLGKRLLTRFIKFFLTLVLYLQEITARVKFLAEVSKQKKQPTDSILPDLAA